MSTDWDLRWIAMAKEVASWSKDPNKQVGAILVSPDNRQCNIGYNGYPRGMEESDLGGIFAKNEVSIHAEINAILHSAVDNKGWKLYITEAPCLQCAIIIVQKQLGRVICPKPNQESSWYDSQNQALMMLHPQVAITFKE